MSKTFKEGYYDDNWTQRKIDKSSKQKRRKINDYLRNIGRRGIKEKEEVEFDYDDED